MGASGGFASSSESKADTGNVLDERDKSFVEMLRAFRHSGGMARGSDALLLNRLPKHSSRAEGNRERAICFEWGGSLWMPRFQFNPADMSIRPVAALVIGELEAVFDGWEMANWFALPNLWIGDHRPIDMLERCVDSVLGAARADRFIAAG